MFSIKVQGSDAGSNVTIANPITELSSDDPEFSVFIEFDDS